MRPGSSTLRWGTSSALAAGELVRVFDFSAVRKVVDVGGAQEFLSSILRASPATQGILFDLPHVIATAGESITAQGSRGAAS